MAVAAVSAALIGLVVLSYAGEGLFPALVDDHPAALIALAPALRNLALATVQLDPLSYFGIAFPRTMLSAPLFWLLGHWYGDAAVTWLERRTRTWGEMIRSVERGFSRPLTAYPLLFFLPYNFLPLFAGAGGMKLRVTLLVKGAGVLFWLTLIRVVGASFEDPISGVVGWIGGNRVPLLVVSAGLVALSIALEVRSKGETQVESLSHLDEEISEIDDKS